MTTERVILVDEQDRALGSAEKLSAHTEGRLHRAFSVFVFDRAGRVLLQRRARTKYHSGGLWSNTACGHPRPEETTADAARRRLGEEMGFRCELTEAFGFVYRAELDNGLVEYEYDHVLIGVFDGDPAPDPSEVEDWRRVSLAQLRRELRERPLEFTYWLRQALGLGEWRHLEASLPTPPEESAA
ncbi:MAG TPA: isopentenyl-diphosphate Delta-isomerase [Pyrinomonadaceae bacterium]|nr:isopentenyl-diphosphate Delta-isomerase [Pyrinomonadaceae bacterium]